MLWDKTHINMKKNYVVAVSLGLAQLVLHTTAGLAQSASKNKTPLKI